MDFHRILESVPSSGNGIYNGVGPLTQSISLFFVQATIIIAFSSFLGLAGQYLRSPKVIFEIIAGVILGPSALCRDQWFKEAVFPASSLGNLSIVSNIGLTFYLFIIGIELDTKLLMTHARKTAGIAIAGMAVPFAIGIAISRTMINNLQEGEDTSFVSFFVFIGTAMSITAFPVLARILKEGGMIYTKPGAMTIGAAALNDAIAWCLLALAISLANGGSMNQTGYIFGTMVGIAAFNLFVMKPFMEYLVEYAESNNVTLITSNLFAFTICLLFMNAWFTELIGLDSIFGAFLFGLTIPRGSRLYRNCREWIEEFVLTFTLPLYFTLSGLKTDVTLIQTGEQGAMIVLVCFCATVGKLFGCGVSAYLTGNSIRESATIATLMNTRGLVELIVLNVGLSAGILTTRTFSVMVIMCLFTTFITSPIVSIIYPESMRKNVTSEESAGFEMVKRDSEDDLLIESDNLVKKLAVVIEALPQMQPVIQLLSYFIPRSIGSQFAVTAMHFLEATKTSKDEFLGLNPEGRLIRIDEETTDFFHAYQIMEDPAAKKPELLPVTGFCKANSVPVNAFRIEGDAIEYPAELKSVVMSNDCSLICIPFRANSTFARNLFWTSLNNSPAPVLLLLSVHAHKIGSEKDPQEPRSRSGSLFHGNDSYTKTHLDHDEENPPTLFTNQPRDILPLHRRGSVTNQFQKIECAGLAPHEIVILLTGNHADLVILSLLPRFAENSINKIHVLLPKDHYSFNKKVAEAISASKASFSGSGNVLFLEIPSVSTDYDGLYHDSCKIAYDLFVCSFIAPAAVDMATALSTRTARTNTLLAGGLVDMLIHRPEADPIDLRLQSGMPMQYAYSNLTNPELGVIGSKIYEGNHTKSSLVLVVHESIKVQARSSIVTENSNVIEMKPANEPTPSDKIDLEV